MEVESPISGLHIEAILSPYIQRGSAVASASPMQTPIATPMSFALVRAACTKSAQGSINYCITHGGQAVFAFSERTIPADDLGWKEMKVSYQKINNKTNESKRCSWMGALDSIDTAATCLLV